MIKRVFSVIVTLFVVLIMPEPLLCADNTLSGEITVSCYETMRFKSFLEFAAKSFEQIHPDVKVIVDTFSTMPEIKTTILEDGSMVMASDIESDTKKEEDYLARINTEMLSGGGADILAVDIIPYYKYADAGLLEDLRQYMDNDPSFDYNNYQANILDAALYKGGQYILPIDYSFDYLSFDSNLLDADTQSKFSFGKYSYQELVELGYESFIKHFDVDSDYPVRLFNLYANNGSEIGGTLFGELLEADYNEIVNIADKTANFTDGRFVDILETCKQYSDNGYLYTPPDYQAMLREGINITELLNSQSVEKYIYKSTNQLMLIYSFLDSELWLGGIGMGATTDDDTLIGMLSNDKDESSFASSHIYAMNSNSKNKQVAWEFIKFLLSDEMQGSMSITFTPLSKNAAAQKAKLTIASMMPDSSNDVINFERVQSEDSTEDVTASDSVQDEGEAGDSIVAEDNDGTEDIISNDTGDTNEAAEEYDVYSAINELASYSYFDSEVELTDKQQSVFEEYMDCMEQYVPLLNSYVIRDSIIDEMIIKEVQSFFDGTKTAAEVANALQSRVNMYLQE